MTKPVNASCTDESVMCTDINAEQSLMGGQCDELEPELGRCLEFEQDSTQISNVQGHLFPCLSFCEQVLEAPPKSLSTLKWTLNYHFSLYPEAQPQSSTK